MAHKPLVTINQTWQDLTSLISGYSSSKAYNIQLTTIGQVLFCISETDPTGTTTSYTVMNKYEIAVLSSGIVGCWVKINDALTGNLSIEEV